MAEIEFIYNNKDEREFISFILSSPVKLIPSVDYDTAEHTEINTYECFAKYRMKTRQFLILCNDFYESPLAMRSFEKEGTRKYFIIPTEGGPSIQLSLCNEYENGGKKYIGTGSIGYYATYWSSSKPIRLKLPDGVKKLYKSYVKFLKENGRLLKAGKKSFYVGNNTVVKLVWETEYRFSFLLVA